MISKAFVEKIIGIKSVSVECNFYEWQPLRINTTHAGFYSKSLVTVVSISLSSVRLHLISSVEIVIAVGLN